MTWRARVVALLVPILLATAPLAAHAAPTIQPWMPTGMDSIDVWASLARAGFRANRGDSVTGSNADPYIQVSKISYQLLRSLGKSGMVQAPAIRPLIDSLGLEVEVVIEPTLPHFALVMVRNPYRFSAQAIGFFFWYTENKLRYQGVKFESGRGIAMRVWRTRFNNQPFSWGVLENVRNGSLPLGFTLLRMSSNGFFWTAENYPGGLGPDPGGRGDATLTDVNNDGIPELITWTAETGDSTVISCPACPHLITEQTWAERLDGFEPIESRLLPSAFANFVAFIRMLRDGNRSGATRLVAAPELVAQALADGWGRGGGPGDWRVVATEPDETWPHWIVVRHGSGAAAKSWVVHFTLREGRWILNDWAEQRASVPPAGGAR